VSGLSPSLFYSVVGSRGMTSSSSSGGNPSASLRNLSFSLSSAFNFASSSFYKASASNLNLSASTAANLSVSFSASQSRSYYLLYFYYGPSYSFLGVGGTTSYSIIC